jgi:hypothetical protein
MDRCRGDNGRMNWKAAHAGLRELLWDWDPLGVADLAPDDEYDCIIEPLLGRLNAGADQSAIGQFLRHELESHFGMDPAEDEIDSVVDRLVTWWAGAAPALTDPDAPTPCPACGAGPDQATDPEHMLHSVCYCGHPRYYDYKHRDGTCPCLAPQHVQRD